MTTPTPMPKSKANELIDEINAVGNDEITSDRLAEIEVEALRIEEADPIGSFVLRGVIAGIRRELDGIDRYFSSALSDDPTNVFILANYATALSRVGETDRAIEIIDEAVSVDYDAEVMQKAFALHLDAYDTHGASRYLKALSEMDVVNDTEQVERAISDIADVFHTYDIDWRMASERVNLTTKAIIGVSNALAGSSVFIHDGMIVHQYLIEDSVKNAAMVESVMLDAIANQSYKPVDNILSFSCAVR